MKKLFVIIPSGNMGALLNHVLSVTPFSLPFQKIHLPQKASVHDALDSSLLFTIIAIRSIKVKLLGHVQIKLFSYKV